MTASRTLGSVVGVMLIGAAMGFDVLKVYGGGEQGNISWCVTPTGSGCYVNTPIVSPAPQTDQASCIAAGNVWGNPNVPDETNCNDQKGTWTQRLSGTIGGYWTPYFLTLGTLSALFAVAIIIYYLIYFRPYTSQFTIVGIITFLVGGVILEYFLMSQYHDTYNGPVSSATYFVIAVNTLVRLWVLLDVGCYDPKTTISGVLAAEAGKQIQKVANVAQEAVKSTKELEGVDLVKFFERLWPSMKQSLETAGLDEQKRRDVRNSVLSQLGPKPATGGRSKRR